MRITPRIQGDRVHRVTRNLEQARFPKGSSEHFWMRISYQYSPCTGQVARAGRSKEMIVPEGPPTPDPRKSTANEPLVVALARAHHWMDLLDTGRYATIAALARDLGVDRTYVSRLLRFTLLAPDIVTAILRGDEPCGLSFRKLRTIPLTWGEQRVTHGIDPAG